jgi:Leucine-rich repeat (LRR) protein
MRPGAYGRPFRGLPPDLFDEIFCTALDRCTDDDFLAFADLTGTRIINIGYVYPSGLILGHGISHKVSDQGMRHIAGLERLEEFSLKSYQITDQGIAVLADKPGLHVLRLCYASATASGLRVLPLETLTELRIEWTKTIGPDLSFLDRCSSLEHLGLRLAGVNDTQVRHIGRLGQLRYLDLGHNRPNERFELTEAITDQGVEHLRNLTDLEALYLDGTKITDATARHLHRLRNLTTLSASQTAISSGFMPPVGELVNLETLDLSRTSVSSSGLRYLTELPRLKVLGLQHTRIDDTGLGYLARMPSLEKLDLFETLATADGLAKLADLPNLKTLRIWDLVQDPAEQARVQALLPDVDIEFELDL